MGRVIEFPIKPYRKYVSSALGEDVKLISDRDASRLLGIGFDQLVELLSSITPVLYFREDQVLQLRKRIKETANVQ